MREPELNEFEASLREAYPAFAGVLNRNFAEFGPDWRRDLNDSCSALFGSPAESAWREALRGYVVFTMSAMRDQAYFEKHGRYVASHYEDTARDVYQNAEVMLGSYLPGLFLSTFLWPHHYRLLQFFRANVIPFVEETRPSTFSEVGVGTGVHSLEMLRAMPALAGAGYDVSPSAVDFCARIMQAAGVDGRYAVERRDVLVDPPAAADFLICHEVLEHLEDPGAFLVGLHRLVRPGGRAYITAAVTAAHPDHIYLFTDPAEVRALLRDSGFSPLLEHTVQGEVPQPTETPPRIAAFCCVRA